MVKDKGPIARTVCVLRNTLSLCFYPHPLADGSAFPLSLPTDML
jgi:hypothetical protein